MVKMARNIATKQTIAKIKKWKYRDEADNELQVNDFFDKSDYRLMTVQCEDYFHKYKSKAIYSIHYFSNKFVVPMFTVSGTEQHACHIFR